LTIKNKFQLDLKRLLPPVALAVLAIFYMLQAGGFSDATSAEAPMLYGVILLGLSILVFVLALVPGMRASAKPGRTRHEAFEFQWKPSLAIYAMMAGLVALVFLAGFYVAIPVFLFLFLKFVSRVSLLRTVICAAAAYGFTWLVFSYFLHLEVYAGYLAGYT
jgi:Tripartite tricarboxylate transporter TctB family